MERNYTILETPSEPSDVLAARYCAEEIAVATQYLFQLRGARGLGFNEVLDYEATVVGESENYKIGLVSTTVGDARIAVAAATQQQCLYDLSAEATSAQPVNAWIMEQDGVTVQDSYQGGTDKAQDLAYLKYVNSVLAALCEADYEAQR